MTAVLQDAPPAAGVQAGEVAAQDEAATSGAGLGRGLAAQGWCVSPGSARGGSAGQRRHLTTLAEAAIVAIARSCANPAPRHSPGKSSIA